MRIGSLFSGYGGLSLACEAVFGGTTAWVSDVDKGANKVLAHRFPDAPNLGDITKVDWSSVEPVDVLDGGFPCQDLSGAGKRAGLRPGTRSGLWTHMAYAISELRPRYVVAENVRGLLSAKAHSDLEPCPWCMGGGGDGQPDVRALGAVLGDLAELGYDARWCGLRASDVGAPHNRFRVFVLAADTRSQGHGSSQADCGLLGRMDGENEGEARQRQRARAIIGNRVETDERWGKYAAAIWRWQQITERVAPDATVNEWDENPAMNEWMMGLPGGWITDTPGVTHNEALKLAGNGVVPQQAEAALRFMLSSR